MSADRYDGMAHPGDLISGLLDGELDPTTTARVVHHLDRCPPCARELDETREIRFTVRTLPEVEPPAGFLASLLAADDGPAAEGVVAPVVGIRSRDRRRAAASAAVSLAAAVALFVLAVGSPVDEPAQPEVAGAVALHASALSLVDGATTFDAGLDADPVVYRSTSSTVHWQREVAVPEPFVAPNELAGGYRLVEVFRKGSGVHLLYTSPDGHALSVFEQPGRCDFDALPAGGRRLDVGGHDGWRLEVPGVDGRVVVVDHDGVMVVVVGDDDGEAVRAAAASIPGPPSWSTAARLRRSAAVSLRHLAPTG